MVLNLDSPNKEAVTKERDDETGQFKKIYNEDRIQETLAGTRLSTREVAGELDCHRTTAHRVLKELEHEGKVSSTRVGNTLIWEID